MHDKYLQKIQAENAFSRANETRDCDFYEQERMVAHLDSLALESVKKLIGELVVESNPLILDLMSSWDSHLPDKLHAAKVVGLGLNAKELSQNPRLAEYVIHDLNENPKLPFPDATFDVVLNTVSVDYMTKPLEVFRDTARILKPGGLFLVIFSNRMFAEKAVKIWQDSTEEERVFLVEYFFKKTDLFETPITFVSKDRPRPQDDRYSGILRTSDPIYAVYADKKGGTSQPRSGIAQFEQPFDKETVAQRKKQVKHTLRCPHCDARLQKWAVPENPFETTTWDNDFLYACFNDSCHYYVNGWKFMENQGNPGVSYRFMYNPVKDCCFPVPVPNENALKEGIISEP